MTDRAGPGAEPDDGAGASDPSRPEPATDGDAPQTWPLRRIWTAKIGSEQAVASARPSGGSSEDQPARPVPPPGIAAPSRSDSVVRMASQVIGGPAGQRLASGRGVFYASTILVLLAMMLLGLGAVQKQHCRAVGWTTPDQFWHTCYSDIPVLYGGAGLGGQDRPGLQEVVAHGSLGPPVQAAAMWGVSALVHGSPRQAARRYFDLSTVVLGAVLAATVGLVVIGSRRRCWDAAHVALAPILVTVALVNYDLLGVALMTAALVAWGRRHPVLAGVLFGLAAGAKPLTALLVVAVFAVALRAGRLVPFVALAVSGVLTWFGVRLLLFPGWDGGLKSSWESFKGVVPGYGSIWLVPQLLSQSQPKGTHSWYSGPTLGAAASTTANVLGLIVVVVVAVTLVLVAPQRPRLALIALFIVASSLLVSKAVPVQASLILLPLVAFAGLRWRDHLLWAVAELGYFVGTWMYIAGLSKPDRGLPAGFYLVLLVVRLAAIAWLVVQAVRLSLHSDQDPVRTPDDGEPGQGDPLGGLATEDPEAHGDPDVLLTHRGELVGSAVRARVGEPS